MGGTSIGIVIWFLLLQFGFIPSFAGFLICYGAIKGYCLSEKRLDKNGIVVALCISVLMVSCCIKTSHTLLENPNYDYINPFMDWLDNIGVNYQESVVVDTIGCYLTTFMLGSKLFYNEYQKIK